MAEKGVSQSQLAAYSGLAEATISRLVTGQRKRPTPDTMDKLADALGVDVADMYAAAGYSQNSVAALRRARNLGVRHASGEPVVRDQRGEYPVNGALAYQPDRQVMVPVVGRIAAGSPILAQEEIIGEEPVDVATIKAGQRYFWLKVRGNSMIGAGIMPGSLVLVQEQPEVPPGAPAVVIVNGDEATVKYVRWRAGAVELVPDNADLEPTRHDPQDVRIVGRVIEAKLKFA